MALRSAPFLDLGGVINGLQGALIGPTVTLTGTKVLEARLKELSDMYGNPQQFVLTAAEGYRTYMVTNYLNGQRLRRRSGTLVNRWRTQLLSKHEALLSPGLLPYARVHEYGLDYPFQPVRGYTTRGGRKVDLYFRDMKLRERRYVRDTVINAEQQVWNRLNAVAQAQVLKNSFGIGE